MAVRTEFTGRVLEIAKVVWRKQEGELSRNDLSCLCARRLGSKEMIAV